MRSASPPESVPAGRSSERYSRPTFSRKPRLHGSQGILVISQRFIEPSPVERDTAEVVVGDGQVVHRAYLIEDMSRLAVVIVGLGPLANVEIDISYLVVRSRLAEDVARLPV